MNASTGKVASLILAAACFTVSAQAFEEAGRVKKATPLSQVVTQPYKFIGKPILVKKIQCASDPKGDIMCAIKVGGKVLRITARMYGPHTSVETLEHIIDECKGTANMVRDECTFSIQVEPVSKDEKIVDTEYGTVPVVAIFSWTMDLFREN